MINQNQARALIDSVEYRDWVIENVDAHELVYFQLMGMISAEVSGRIPVRISYTAPNSDPGKGGERVQNNLHITLPLTETEAEFARAVYEAISVIEEHERREFFKIGYGEIDHHPVERRSRAIFHPHGVRRNKMFHELDPFAKAVRLEALADGGELTADAVA